MGGSYGNAVYTDPGALNTEAKIHIIILWPLGKFADFESAIGILRMNGIVRSESVFSRTKLKTPLESRN